MERYTMILDGKNQHCENDYTTQSNLQIQCNPYRIINGIFSELEQKILKFVWRHKRPQIAKNTLSKNKKPGDTILPDFKIFYKAAVIKTVLYWHKNRHIYQWNKIERLEINSPIYDLLIFKNGVENTQWGKYVLFHKWR